MPPTDACRETGSRFLRALHCRARVRRFRRDEDGATAVEFALISIPFFALLFAILETALVFWSTQVLETAVADSSRRIYTGEFQTANNGTTDPNELARLFKDDVCSRVVALFDCQGLLHVDVTRVTGFARPQPPVDPNTNTFNTTGWTYQQTGAGEIVLVRAAMEYPVFVTLLSSPETTLASGKRLIMASAAFRNEPFGN